MTLEELDALKAYDDDYKKDQPRGAWREVFSQKEEAYITQLVSNYDQLKTIYNNCVDQVKSTQNWEKQYKITSSYPCKQASHARIKLQLPSDNFQTHME